MSATDVLRTWLETGERLAAEIGPAAIEDALGDTLTARFGWWGPVLAPFGPEPAEVAR